VNDEALDAFEAEFKVRLPQSYRQFCKDVGPGELRGAIWVHIAAPGLPESKDDPGEAMKRNLELLNKEIWSIALLELDDYCPHPELVRSGIFFGRDLYTYHYFWNKAESTNSAASEMGIYLIDRQMRTCRVADTFESFIFDVCLGRGIPDHEKSDQEPPEFWPVDE
jgi:hypothetical protein